MSAVRPTPSVLNASLEISPMHTRPDHIPARMAYRFVDGVAVPTKPRGDARRFRPLRNSGLPAVARGLSSRAYPEANAVLLRPATTHADGNRSARRG